ncbi:MAG: HAD-IB family phosphatase [Nanoarchaeota archaeon]|nr:HAD-IB family phosphatase [Nanoarchaeota archaeon]MBU1270225.1 HAD-IB family phosphatase [Nanoarchaeota archaeon]MBU1604589.1 HAD-IB family phosphatase [Nanoarchaeota archaeon]MBU2443535.1 HAD-IB family phosphatase [Nanoarchaeota archaeon]
MMKKIKALVFDVDGTLVKYANSKFHSGWDALGNCLDEKTKKVWFDNLEEYYPQKDKIIEWTEKDAALLKGFALKDTENTLFPNSVIPYNKGFVEFFNNISNGYVVGMVSGGINLVTDKIREDFPGKFDFVITNILGVNNGYLDGTVKAFDMWKKDEILENILRTNYRLSLDNVCYVGDSRNDVCVLQKVGLPIVFDSKAADNHEAKLFARYVINDFQELSMILNDYS